MRRYPVSTFALIVVNLIIFGWLAIRLQNLTMGRNVDVLTILHAGANLNPFTLGGEPWRIITSMFLHYGIFHLALNMLALFSMGRILEPALGTPRFLMVYFLCGIGSGVFSLLFNVYAISAGASGALFGLYGYSLGGELIGSYRNREKLVPVVINFFIFILINAYLTAQFKVDLSGHIGGGVTGLFLAVLHTKYHVLWKHNALAITLCLSPAVLLVLPRDQLNYYRVFQRVIKAERFTDRLFDNNLNDFQIRDSLIAILPEWHSIDSALSSLPGVPHELVSDTTNLHDYITLRAKEAGYRIALIERESFIYLDSLEVVSSEFKEIPPFEYSLNFDIPEDQEETELIERTPQHLESRRIFYDASWKEIDDPSAASYYRIGTTDSLGRWQGPVMDFYRNGDIQMKGKYTDDLKNGVFLYYSDHGTYSSAGRYVMEDAVGKWENYHWNGALESEVYYNNGSYTKVVLDSLGRTQVVNGNGTVKTWYPTGVLSSEGNYRDGRREGDWYGYHPDGSPYYHELYRNNRLMHGVSLDVNGKRYVYDQLSQFPFPVVGMKAFNAYLKQNSRKSEIPGENGKVKVIFNVGVDGAIWDFVIIQSLTLRRDQEAIHLIREGPAWRPGLMHGHEKRISQGYVEVTF
jgi:membrane associated rhomboid family serine protease